MMTADAPTIEFKFKQALFPVNVQIKNELICVRYSVKYFEVSLRNLKYVYLDDDPQREMLELILCAIDSKGIRRRLRMFSDRNESDFEALVGFLANTVGDGYLKDVEREQAYEIMGAKDQSHIYVPLLLAICLLIIGAFMSPHLLHSFEDEVTLDTLSQLFEKHRTENHVMVLGATVDLTSAVFEPPTPSEVHPLESRWHPIHDASIAHAPVRVLARFYSRHGTPQARPKRLTGIVRRAGLERVPTYVRKAFESQGLSLHEEVIYIDVGATPQDEFIFFVGVMGLMGFLAGGIIVAIHRRRRERARYLERKNSRVRRAIKPSPRP